MRDALVTRGINVRPMKVRHEGRPPRGIAVSAHYAHWTPPVRERKSRARTRLAAAAGASSLAAQLDSSRAAMHAAQDRVRELKAQGVDRRSREFKSAAQASREARSRWIALNGGLEGRTIEVASASDANKIKPAQD